MTNRIIEPIPGHFEGFRFIQSPMVQDAYDFAKAIGQPGIHVDVQHHEWMLPDGLVPGDVRHEAARGPLWPGQWTAVRRAVLEVVS